jgi:CBS domain-containing protein
MTLVVRDVMTRTVVAVPPSLPLKEVARLLVEHRISGVPVIDDHGAVLGVVSEADLLLKEQGPDAVRHRRFAWLLGESSEMRTLAKKLAAATAEEAMTTPAATIEAGRSTTAAAELMVERGVNRLPVVEDGRLVGLVSRADLVRAFVRSDTQLADVIREEVLKRILWLDPTHYRVGVTDGVARISGRAGRRSTAEMIERAIEAVPGIVRVDRDVTWDLDDDRIAVGTEDHAWPSIR